MTWPLTFSSAPFDWYLTNEEEDGRRAAEREKAEVARGSYRTGCQYSAQITELGLQLTLRANREDNIMTAEIHTTVSRYP